MWGGRRQEIGHKSLIYRSLSQDGENGAQYVYVTENHGAQVPSRQAEGGHRVLDLRYIYILTRELSYGYHA
jgi:hypothetical protein